MEKQIKDRKDTEAKKRADELDFLKYQANHLQNFLRSVNEANKWFLPWSKYTFLQDLLCFLKKLRFYKYIQKISIQLILSKSKFLCLINWWMNENNINWLYQSIWHAFWWWFVRN